MNILFAFPLAFLFGLTGAPGAYAAPGHDHDAAPFAAADSPRRLPDGSVFLPKPTQRQIGVRTQPVARADLSITVELAGRIVMDPNAGGTVQALVGGRLAPGPKGLPYPGQTVKKGELLAYVRPEAGGDGRSLAASRLERLRALADTVPRKTIEAAEAAVASERLTAPVGGAIASTRAVSGQVVAPGETLFEVVDPHRVLVEALAYDLTLAGDVGTAFLAIGDARLPPNPPGAAHSLRDQVLSLFFRGKGAQFAALAVGQPVRVFAQRRARISGLQVPAAALARDPANQTVVWIKLEPERFAPRPVSIEPLDGVSVAVVAGLKPGDRVVVRGVPLINAIR